SGQRGTYPAVLSWGGRRGLPPWGLGGAVSAVAVGMFGSGPRCAVIGVSEVEGADDDQVAPWARDVAGCDLR
ncbi:MAG TPA: hypothetical protein VGP44_13150, partial [Gemmatimonadales bacterium]|nr:hypothetical protein [Gemmatimonadales bacterium]